MASAVRRVLFLCTGNSCRSQMAEGFARALHPGVLEAYSAGTRPQGLNPFAVRAMAEVGIDISAAKAKHPEALSSIPFDLVVTVCDAASEACPVLPGAARTLHAPFDDPPALARSARSDDEAMNPFRRVRDEIRRFVEELPQILPGETTMAQRSCCDDACCPPASAPAAAIADPHAVREHVREGYAKIAEAGTAGDGGCCGGGTCGESYSPDEIAKAVGYGGADLAAMPQGANMGLSCGNPTAIASLRPGEVVLDLGSGGGFDCFIAGPRVGTTGRVIGVDMTPQMLAKAKANIAPYRKASGLDNVEFRLGEIENLPIADQSVDVVISNCVLNLSPDKPRVWREIARVLRPGGRVAVSDLALLRPLPESVRSDIQALVGCIAGAVLVEETRAMAAAAGLRDIRLTPKPEYIDAMTNWEDPLYRRIIAGLPAGSKTSDYITSLDVAAAKPG